MLGCDKLKEREPQDERIGKELSYCRLREIYRPPQETSQLGPSEILHIQNLSGLSATDEQATKDKGMPGGC